MGKNEMRVYREYVKVFKKVKLISPSYGGYKRGESEPTLEFAKGRFARGLNSLNEEGNVGRYNWNRNLAGWVHSYCMKRCQLLLILEEIESSHISESMLLQEFDEDCARFRAMSDAELTANFFAPKPLYELRYVIGFILVECIERFISCLRINPYFTKEVMCKLGMSDPWDAVLWLGKVTDLKSVAFAPFGFLKLISGWQIVESPLLAPIVRLERQKGKLDFQIFTDVKESFKVALKIVNITWWRIDRLQKFLQVLGTRDKEGVNVYLQGFDLDEAVDRAKASAGSAVKVVVSLFGVFLDTEEVKFLTLAASELLSYEIVFVVFPAEEGESKCPDALEAYQVECERGILPAFAGGIFKGVAPVGLRE